MLLIIVGGPLFVLALEKGWRELTFSKGTRRWEIFLGRYLATTTIYFIMAMMSGLPLALRLWWHTGIPTWPLVVAILIQTFSFASLLAIGALASMAGGGVALPILAPFAVAALPGLLIN